MRLELDILQDSSGLEPLLGLALMFLIPLASLGITQSFIIQVLCLLPPCESSSPALLFCSSNSSYSLFLRALNENEIRPKGGKTRMQFFLIVMISSFAYYLIPGSRLTNFVGILSQGLRIAPPEAPATGYMLTLRRVMDTAKQSTPSGSLNEVSMVLLNNALSFPFATFLIIVFGEWEYVYKVDVVRDPFFWVVATASGLLGLSISFTSMWFLNQTGPTTYSLVGSLNKIPISLAGILLFNVPVSVPNLFSIFFGLFAGVFFAKAKMS